MKLNTYLAFTNCTHDKPLAAAMAAAAEYDQQRTDLLDACKQFEVA